MIKIEKIKVKDMVQFACKALNDPVYTRVLPLTRGRAAAYAGNPCADPEDVGLLVAYDGDHCVGYLGMLPGMLKTGQSLSKVYWFSTFFVSPESRGTGIGTQLVKEAFLLGYDFCVTSMARLSEKTFRKAGMEELGPLCYQVIDIRVLCLLTAILRLFRELLRKVKREFVSLNSLIRSIDALFLGAIKSVFYGFLGFFSRSLKKDQALNKFMYRQADFLSDDEFRLDPNGISFMRGPQVINWMIANKWTKESGAAEEGDRRYFFAGPKDRFEYRLLKIFDSHTHEYRGFAVFSLAVKGKESVMKVLDFQIDGSADYIGFLALEFAASSRATRIEIPEALQGCCRRNFLLRAMLHTIRRVYLYHARDNSSRLAAVTSRIRLDYCDGDSAFF